MTVKFPQVTVQLIGQDGNAWSVLGAVSRAMKKESVPKDSIAQYMDDAMSGDYTHLLAVTLEWVNVE